MKWTGKVVGGVIGLMAGGPVGAALGALVGHQFDSAVDEGDRLSGPGLGSGVPPQQTAEQFFISTFRVMGHVAKVDGRVSENEIRVARGIRTSPRQRSRRPEAPTSTHEQPPPEALPGREEHV